MATHGKPNSTGRSSGKRVGRERKILGPPKGEPWVWLTRELIESDAWQMRSRQCVIFIEALLIEHMAHAGNENGRLKATYDQLQALGARRSSIRKAIMEGRYLGLVKVTRHGGRWAMTNRPSLYRLTFLPTIEDGIACEPTNEWKQRSAPQIKRWRSEMAVKSKATASQKKQNASNDSGTTVVPFSVLPGAITKSDKK